MLNIIPKLVMQALRYEKSSQILHTTKLFLGHVWYKIKLNNTLIDHIDKL